MTTQTETIIKPYMKTDLPNLQSGDTVRVHQKVKEGDKERIQVFEGVVLARKHGKGVSATITVRKISQGVAVERIFPIHSPMIQKIEVVRQAKVRRAKLYYLRHAKGKKARLRAKEFGVAVAEESKVEKPAQSPEGIEAGPPESNEAGFGGKES